MEDPFLSVGRKSRQEVASSAEPTRPRSATILFKRGVRGVCFVVIMSDCSQLFVFLIYFRLLDVVPLHENVVVLFFVKGRGDVLSLEPRRVQFHTTFPLQCSREGIGIEAFTNNNNNK